MIQTPDNMHLERTMQQIINAVAPERIYLLGAGNPSIAFSSVFADTTISVNGMSHYYFLVIKSFEESRANDEIQDRLEQRKGHATDMTVIVLGCEQFKQWLQVGSPFAILVANKAQFLYDAETFDFPTPSSIDSLEQISAFRKDWIAYSKTAEAFLCAAELHALRQEWNNCLFNTHQAAEQLFLGLIKVCIGYKPTTHNMDKLQRYARLMSEDISRLFPRDTEAEQQLFDTFQKSYAATRYNKDYKAGEKETRELLKRIEKLMVITGALVSPHVAAVAQ